MSGGRVDLSVSDSADSFDFMDSCGGGSACGSVGLRQENSPLGDIFFSTTNLDALQGAIRTRVYIQSGRQHVISRQSDTEVKIVMRAMFLSYAQHRTDTLQEVRELNARVLDFCVPQILNEISMYLHYRKDVSVMSEPLDRGEMASSKGTRVLEMMRR